MLLSVRLSVRPSILSVCLMTLAQNGAFWGYGYRGTPIGNPVMEVKANEVNSDRNKNGNEAVAGAASEAFARWLHHRYAPPNCRQRAAYRSAVRYLVSF